MNSDIIKRDWHGNIICDPENGIVETGCFPFDSECDFWDVTLSRITEPGDKVVIDDSKYKLKSELIKHSNIVRFLLDEPCDVTFNVQFYIKGDPKKGCQYDE